MGRYIDEIGNRYGKLGVIADIGRDRNGNVLWLCKCDCGNETVVAGNNLRRGRTQSCGCLRKKLSEGWKQKISESCKGRKLSKTTKRKISETLKGENSYWYGKHLSEEHRQKISKNNAHLSGKNHPNYKHGLAGTKSYKNQANSKRRAQKLNQTPVDANMSKILEIYSICALMNEISTNVKWEVDHIIPLSKGGLHHQDNLQILTKEANHKKHAKTTDEYKGITLKDLILGG
jgi:hypothetical protein